MASFLSELLYHEDNKKGLKVSYYIDHTSEKNIDVIEKCFEEKGNTEDEYTAFYTLKSKKIKHDISVQLYNKCKSFYKSVKIPTRVVYFDEVRKNKKKQKVGVFE